MFLRWVTRLLCKHVVSGEFVFSQPLQGQNNLCSISSSLLFFSHICSCIDRKLWAVTAVSHTFVIDFNISSRKIWFWREPTKQVSLHLFQYFVSIFPHKSTINGFCVLESNSGFNWNFEHFGRVKSDCLQLNFFVLISAYNLWFSYLEFRLQTSKLGQTSTEIWRRAKNK